MLLGFLDTDVFAPESCLLGKQVNRPRQTPKVAYAAVAFYALHPDTSMRQSAKPHCMPETQEALVISPTSDNAFLVAEMQYLPFMAASHA